MPLHPRSVFNDNAEVVFLFFGGGCRLKTLHYRMPSIKEEIKLCQLVNALDF